MGRELRRVPKDWEHPRKPNGRYQPMFDESYDDANRAWDMARENFAKGLDPRGEPLPPEAAKWSYEEWHGEAPDPEYYRPAWPEESRTHFQMYENTTEGTPISPVCETIEECAKWCADNNASAFADEPADYNWWLHVCKGLAGIGIAVDSNTGRTRIV